MKDCSEVRKLLSEYIDGVLSGESSWGVQLHLAACGDCARVAQDLAGVVRVLQSTRPIALSGSFDASLEARVTTVRSRSKKLLGHAWGIRQTYGARNTCSIAVQRSLALSAVAIAAVAIAMAPAALRWDRQHGGTGSVTSSELGTVTRPTDVLAAGDLAFVAACSSQHAQYASSQPLADPSAETLASQIDETGGAGGTAPAIAENPQVGSRADDRSATD